MTITLTREEAQQVLDELCGAKLCEMNSMSSRGEMLRLIDKAIETLRARLSAPEPSVEPVAKWEPKIARMYSDDGALFSVKIKYTVDGEWQDLP